MSDNHLTKDASKVLDSIVALKERVEKADDETEESNEEGVNLLSIVKKLSDKKRKRSES